MHSTRCVPKYSAPYWVHDNFLKKLPLIFVKVYNVVLQNVFMIYLILLFSRCIAIIYKRNQRRALYIG
jgi:hypothetical protein